MCFFITPGEKWSVVTIMYHSLLFIMSFKREMLIPIIFNGLIGHHLDFPETDWSAKYSHDKIFACLTNSQCLSS